MPETLISSILSPSSRFFRSTDLVRDFEDPRGLDEYYLTDFGRACLQQIADGFRPESGRRAWRLTGDFGSGKSSFALLLANALRDPQRLPKKLCEEVLKSFPLIKNSSFVPVLITGSREPMAHAVVRSLHHTLATLYTRGAKSSLMDDIERTLKQKVISDEKALDLLVETNAKLIQSGKGDGLLLIMDEVGKFLEFAALNPDRQDVYFLQQLAEMACRSGKQPFVVICLFHQGLSAYAEPLAKATQQEWIKIGGRFDEIVFHQPLDQIALLTAAALGTETKKITPFQSDSATASMEQAIALGWYGTSASRDPLRQIPASLFPLDPMVLPVLVRIFRRFGQNERSLFSFIYSHEPYGLQAFVQQPLLDKTRPYQLDDLYDYVRANFGHRLSAATYRSHWNVIESTIEAYQPHDPAELRVLKTVGLLNLLNADDLLPTEDAVTWAIAGNSVPERNKIARILEAIADTPALYFRGKGRGYSVWPHTSVDLDARLAEAKNAVPFVGSISKAIATQLPMQPMVARAHYIKTGNLRYFDIVYCQPDELIRVANEYSSRADGFILVPLCETTSDTKSCKRAIADVEHRIDTIRLIAIPQPLCNLNQAVLDVQHWEWVQAKTPELNNDRIARDEVKIYLQEAEYRLKGQVQAYLGLSRYSGSSSLEWHYYDHEGKSHEKHLKSKGVLELLSSLCDQFFAQAPIIKNELVNRHNLSSAAAGARMRLIELMFASSEKQELGMPTDRKPPEKSMYFSVLKNTNLHRKAGGGWTVGIPSKHDDVCNVRPVLGRIKEMLGKKPDVRIPVSVILDDLRRPPYGLRDGLFPILIAVIAIEGEHEIAFYENGTFLRDIGRDAFLRMTKAPEKFEIQLCKIEGVRSTLFHQLAQVLELTITGQDVELLDVVRNLCQFVARLPEYSRTTSRLDSVALAVRNVILQASDPVKMVFHDLPEACGFQKFAIGKSSDTKDAQRFVQTLKQSLDDLRAAFTNLEGRMETSLAEAFGYEREKVGTYRLKLAERAERLLVRVTENKLKAFSFRLFDEALPEKDWLASVGSVLALRPPDKWKDEDEETFRRELENVAGLFNRVESAAFDKGSNGHGVRVAITQADGTERQEVVLVDVGDEKLLKQLQEEIMSVIKKNHRLGLAAASQAIWSNLKAQENSQ